MTAPDDPTAGLSAAQKELLARRLRGRRAGGGDIPVADDPVLSFGQERLWYLQQLHPDSAAYHIHAVFSIAGPLHAQAFVDALQAVLRRHEVFRTAIKVHDGAPAAALAQPEGLRVDLVDLASKPPAEQVQRIAALGEAQAHAPFDLAAGVLVRSVLVRRTEQSHTLLFTCHHIALDEASVNLIWQETAAAYEGREMAPAIQYKDFAAWQRQLWSQGALDEQMNVWRERLAGIPAPLNLPRRTDADPAALTGGHLRVHLPAALSARLREHARTQHTSLFVVALSAYVLLLSRYTGSRDVTVGVPVSNRNRSQLEQLPGFLMNTLPLRAAFEVDTTFNDLVALMHERAMEMLANQDVPFEQLVREFAGKRQHHQNPLFQTMFVLQTPPEALTLGEATSADMEIAPTREAKFDLTFFVADAAEGLSIALEYRAGLFSSEFIQDFLKQFEELSERVLTDPDTAVDAIETLSAAQRAKILSVCSGRQYARPEVAIQDLIFSRAEQWPDAVALTGPQTSLTYAQMCQRADQLAGSLSDRFNTQGALIALHLGRSVDFVVVLLAVLRAGAAYVPLDPRQPAARLQEILDDAGPIAIICGEADPGFDTGATAVVTLEELAAMSHSPQMHTPTAAPGSLAYVLYTSGSSGKPKGVCVRQSNLVHSTVAREIEYPKAPSSFLLVSSVGFDSSVAGIFWTLISGGKLVLPASGEENDVSRLAAYIEAEAVSHTLCLPSLYKILLDFQVDALRRLEGVIVAGEACDRELVVNHFEHLPDVGLYNEYGPTEATVWATLHTMTPADGVGQVAIGKPIANCQVRIVNSRGVLLPPGAVGELWLGGDGIAAGYLNQPELTRAAFVADPDNPQRVMYRTGDLARLRHDGLLDFVGRKDRQVKLRGYRIELEEIERRLAELPGVDAGAVVLWTGDTNTDAEALWTRLLALDPALVSALLADAEQV